MFEIQADSPDLPKLNRIPFSPINQSPNQMQSYSYSTLVISFSHVSLILELLPQRSWSNSKGDNIDVNLVKSAIQVRYQEIVWFALY